MRTFFIPLLFLTSHLIPQKLFALSVTAVSAATVDSASSPSKVFIPTASAVCVQTAGVYPTNLTILDRAVSGKDVVWFDVTPTKTSATVQGSDTFTFFSVVAHKSGDNTKLIPLVDSTGVAGYLAANYNYSPPYALKYASFGNTIRVGIPLADVSGVGINYCNFLTTNGTGQGGNDCDVDSSATAPNEMGIDICITHGSSDKCDATKADAAAMKLVMVNCPPANGVYPTVNFSVAPLDGQVKLVNSTTTPSGTVSGAGLLMYSQQSTTAVIPTNLTATTTQFVNGTNGLGTYIFENLTNELQYCFNIAYVNVAGLVSLEGGLTAEKCATPSKIEGFLNRSTCFIATAAFGSETDGRVLLLREFRDKILLKTSTGLKFVKWYYSWSPGAADTLRERPVLRSAVAYALYPVVASAAVLLFLQAHFLIFLILLGSIALFLVLRKYHKLKETLFLWMLLGSVLLLISQNTLATIEKSDEKSGAKNEEAAQKVQPYIESLKRGKTLHAKISKIPKSAFGLTVNVASSFDVKSSGQQANSFEKVYTPGGKYAYGFNLSYEYKLLQHRVWGTLGPVGQIYFINLKGKGVFTNRGESTDDVNMVFTSVPLAAGASYRVTQFKLLVPFAQLSYALIPVMEKRDDGKSSRRAISAGTLVSFGASLNLDWISGKSYWNQYENNSVIHSYLTVQRHLLRTNQGAVSFNTDATYVGLLFEL